MILTIVVFLPLGAILEGVPAVGLLTPILLPLATQLGIDPVHYGAVIVATQGISAFLPPVGVKLAGGLLGGRGRAVGGGATAVAVSDAHAGAYGGDCPGAGGGVTSSRVARLLTLGERAKK